MKKKVVIAGITGVVVMLGAVSSVAAFRRFRARKYIEENLNTEFMAEDVVGVLLPKVQRLNGNIFYINDEDCYTVLASIEDLDIDDTYLIESYDRDEAEVCIKAKNTSASKAVDRFKESGVFTRDV